MKDEVFIIISSIKVMGNTIIMSFGGHNHITNTEFGALHSILKIILKVGIFAFRFRDEEIEIQRAYLIAHIVNCGRKLWKEKGYLYFR